MKHRFTIFFMFCFALGFSQTPELINYQAVIRDSVGQILSNQQIDFQLSILKGSALGLSVYEEVHNVTTNDFGQVAIQIGGGTTTSGNFSSIDWGTDDYFLETAIDTEGQGSFTVMGVSQLVSVPYALNSKRTESLILTDQNGNQYEFWVDTLGNIGTYPVYEYGEPCPGMPYIDYQGQTYYTIKVGNQCWLRENLNVGTMINGTIDMQNNDTIEKYCYENDEANCEIYGGLYQWDEMMQYSTTEAIQGICPSGWHLPTDADWCILSQFLDPSVDCNTTAYSGTDIGGKMKSCGTIENGNGLWQDPNYGATNESGFSAIPAGHRNTAGNFWDINTVSYFWSSSFPMGLRHLSHTSSQIWRGSDTKLYGFSIRCVNNEFINQPPIEPSNPIPNNSALDIPINSTLNWNCSDPENDLLTFDAYFGTTNPPALMISGQTETHFNSGILTYSETYYWKIVVHDQFNTTEGPIWNFTTVDPPTDGLVAYYPFNGNANDESGNANNGNMINTPNFDTGKNGQAINLNGIDQYVRIPNSVSLNPSQISISTWIKLDSIPSSFAAVIQKYNDDVDDDVIWQIIFGENSDGSIYNSILVEGVGYNAPFNELVVENNWTHLVITFDGSEYKSYFNGIHQSTTPVTGNISSSLYDISIGRGKPITGRWIDGLIDEMRIYNRALSEIEIQGFYSE